jgi:hypothetical protein
VDPVESNGSPSPPARRLAELLFRGSDTESLGSQLERVRKQVGRLEALIRGLGVPADTAPTESAPTGRAPADSAPADSRGGSVPARGTPQRGGYVLFLPKDGGYVLRHGKGECPAPGDHLEGFVVVRLGASPLPGDRRVCVFLQADASGSAPTGD